MPIPQSIKPPGNRIVAVKGSARWALLGVGFIIGFCWVVSSSEGILADGDTVILENPVIEENTTLANGTWEVRGSVLVMNGTLTLDNATVVFNDTYVSYVTVMVNASLICNNSNITGGGLYSVQFWGPSSFVDSTLNNREKGTSVTIAGTSMSLVRCSLRHWKLFVQGSLEAFNCTFFGGNDVVGGNRRAPATVEYHILMVDCNFSSFPGSEYSVVLRGPDDINIMCCATFRRCLLDPCARGFDVQYFKSWGWVVIEGCGIAVAATGINLVSVGGVVHVENCSISGFMGLSIDLVDHVPPTVSNLTIESTSDGIAVSNCPFNMTFTDLNITSHSTGFSGSRARLTILRSWIEGGAENLLLGGPTRVLLIDCEPFPVVTCADSSELTAKRTVDIRRVKWYGGPDIIDGVTNLFTVSNRYTGSIDNAQPRPIPLQYLFINTTYSERSDKVFAKHARDGLVFYSDLYLFMDVPSLVLEIHDDAPPVLTVLSPAPGSIFNSTSIEITGSVFEKGSGISFVRARCDSGNWSDASLKGDGTFHVTVKATGEGDHVIEVTVRDNGGNADDAWIGGILTDLTPPFIIVDGPEHYTNQSGVLLLVRTEKLSRAYLNDVLVEVDARGTIAEWLDLTEGVTSFVIRVIDRAGNVNWTSYVIELDTSPPMLLVDHPVQGGWVNTTILLLEGVTESDATVLIDHEPATRNGVAFSRTFEVPDGERSVLVEAWDRAGNGARLVLTFTVDTQAPTLTIDAPLSRARSNTSQVTLSGRAWDEFHLDLTVDGTAIAVSGGWWTATLELDEGWNDVPVVARDLAGNTARASVTILVDTLPPRATVRLVVDDVEHLDPSTELATARTEAVLRLYTDEACNVTVVGFGTWSIPSGTSELDITLEENTVNVIQVVPVDQVGNAGDAVTFRVLVDTIPPSLEITHPLDSTVVASPHVFINGTTEPGSIVRVQGKELAVLENGTFSAEVVLYEGVNLFEVEALDPVGNRANLTLTILFEPPDEGGNEEGRTLEPWMAWTVVIVACIVVAALVLRRRARRGP